MSSDKFTDISYHVQKQRTFEAHAAGENGSFVLQSVSNLFHFIILSLPI